MSVAKRYYRCAECHTKTSTTNADRADAKVCVRCRPELAPAPVKAKTAETKLARTAVLKAREAPTAPVIERVPGTLAQARELIGSPNGDFEGFRRNGFAVGYLYEESADAPGKKVTIAFTKRRLTDPQFNMKFAALHRQGKLAGTRVTEVMLDPGRPENREAVSDAAPCARAGQNATPALPAEPAAPLPTAVTTALMPPPAAVEAKPGKSKKVSALDAAAMVLRDSGAAMTPKEIFAAIVDRKLWVSKKGKTPDMTIAAAMGREIAAGGADCRFAKPERGKFAANPSVA